MPVTNFYGFYLKKVCTDSFIFSLPLKIIFYRPIRLIFAVCSPAEHTINLQIHYVYSTLKTPRRFNVEYTWYVCRINWSHIHYAGLFFINLQALRLATLLKRRLWHKSFTVNVVIFLRTTFLQNTSGRLLQNITITRFFKYKN